MQTVVDTWLAGGAILGTLHLPASGSATGVVISPPIGQDYTIAYRTLRHLADRIAQGDARGRHGLAAIRYDHPGFGDSTAPQDDDSLEQGARLAAAALRDAGCTRIVYLGLGSGALVASAAATADPAAAGLVLWDAAPSGRHWLRRQKSLYAMAVDQEAEPTPEGLVEIAGAEFTASFAAHVSALGYTADTAKRMPVLVAHRHGAAGSLPKSLQGVADLLDTVEISGHEESLDVSSVLATIPASSVDAVASWLAATFGDAAAKLSAPVAVDEIEFDHEGAPLTETLTRIGEHRLFAVETRPLGAGDDIPGVVLHNGSAEHRVGTTRHQVHLARRLAARGMRVIRVDRRGTGETGVVTADEASLLYTREWVEDGEAAVAHLRLPREKVGVVGMCVGAWIGLVAGPEATRFVAGLSLNDHRTATVAPGAEVAGDSSNTESVPRSTAVLRSIVFRTVAFAKKHLPYAANVALARRGILRFAEPNLRRALSSGTDVLLYLAPEDVKIFDAHGGREAVDRLAATRGRLELVESPTGDHALYSPGIRNAAIAWSVEQAAREFGLAPVPTGRLRV